MPHVELCGFMPYWKSARLMLSSQYSVTLHEPLGEREGWITARYYENLGCGLVNFVDRDYDCGELVIPHKHPLRVASGELADKINGRSYADWIGLQSGLVDPAWADWTTWYYRPFASRICAV